MRGKISLGRSVQAASLGLERDKGELSVEPPILGGRAKTGPAEVLASSAVGGWCA